MTNSKFALTGRLGAVGLFAAILCTTGCNSDGEITPIPPDEVNLTRREVLGKRLFFDTNLSEPVGLSCGGCHNPDTAFSGNNDSTVGVPKGSRVGILGLRNTPSAMYAGFAPMFAMIEDVEGITPTGGQFLDGREDTLAGQARRPFVSELEMNNVDVPSVVAKVSRSSYADLFKDEWGTDIFSRPDDAFTAIVVSIEAFEQTERFHPFTSKYDKYIQGKAQFTAAETRGLALFMDPDKGNCVGCHVADPTSKDPRDSLFTDFTYDNLGVPRNTAIPANADPAFFDLGLCGPKRVPPSDDTSLCGAFKVPTLRNAARKPALMHNGFFKDLKTLVAFYVTRDTDPARWYPGGLKFDDLPPGYRGNVNTSEVPYDRKPGDAPALDDAEIDDLVAFLRTLTDE
ncbi:MAG: cytochrome c peroxidase [Betaproteobacteria bacterium]